MVAQARFVEPAPVDLQRILCQKPRNTAMKARVT